MVDFEVQFSLQAQSGPEIILWRIRVRGNIMSIDPHVQQAYVFDASKCSSRPGTARAPAVT